LLNKVTVDGKRARKKASKALAQHNSSHVPLTPPTSDDGSVYSNESQPSLSPALSVLSSPTSSPLTPMTPPISNQYPYDEDDGNSVMSLLYSWYCWYKMNAYVSLKEMTSNSTSELDLYSLAHEISLMWMSHNGILDFTSSI
jgi:hypothetical protein